MRKYQWMGLIALLLAMLLFSNTLMVSAKAETGTIIGEGISETLEAYDITEDEIWALINKTELRSLVDVDEIRDTISKDKLLKMIDQDEIEKSISDINLLESMKAEEILADYLEKKESGELDELIKEVIESDDFDEDFIRNRPVDIPNITVPISEANSPFDYIIDPQGLIRQTDAARLGGGEVKEGASVLFRNTQGEYKFSDYSDKLKITNKSTIPLQVTICAKIDDPGDIVMAKSSSELGGDVPGLFMALVNEEEILGIITESGSIDINLVLNPVPEGTYKVEYNEETEKYEYVLSENADPSLYDSFSFGLFADCNTDASWRRVSQLPRIEVTWKTEPVLTDWDKVTADFDDDEKVKFTAYKKVKLEQMRKAEIERLVDEQLESLISEEMEPLIEKEVQRLAEEQFVDVLFKVINGEIVLEGKEALEPADGEASDGTGKKIIRRNNDSSGEDMLFEEDEDEFMFDEEELIDEDLEASENEKLTEDSAGDSAKGTSGSISGSSSGRTVTVTSSGKSSGNTSGSTSDGTSTSSGTAGKNSGSTSGKSSTSDGDEVMFADDALEEDDEEELASGMSEDDEYLENEGSQTSTGKSSNSGGGADDVVIIFSD